MSKKIHYDDGVWATLSIKTLGALRRELSEKLGEDCHLKGFTFEAAMEHFCHEAVLRRIPGFGEKAVAEICALIRTEYPDWGKDRWRLPRRWRAFLEDLCRTHVITIDQIKNAIADEEERRRDLIAKVEENRSLRFSVEWQISRIEKHDEEIRRLKKALLEVERWQANQSSSTTAL